MKVDPNISIQLEPECVLCEYGQVWLHDGASTRLEELDQAENAFTQFCRSLDPNLCFILAYIPNDADRDVYFKAREVAGSVGMHMQAPVDTPERHRAMWEGYKTSRSHRLAASEAADGPENQED